MLRWGVLSRLLAGLGCGRAGFLRRGGEPSPRFLLLGVLCLLGRKPSARFFFLGFFFLGRRGRLILGKLGLEFLNTRGEFPFFLERVVLLFDPLAKCAGYFLMLVLGFVKQPMQFHNLFILGRQRVPLLGLVRRVLYHIK